ncbi:MAG: NAD(P)-dependent alcohol dehydrogenase [Rhodospirillaceae bacterium]|nr:NAD(P)-dependent alcohol dehydrogenase [Rhodospirillaceae bacterium]
MKAVAYFAYGGPEVMTLTDLPEPEPRAGYAVVKVAAASINPVDWKLRGGILRLIMGRKFPRVMGADVSGTIHAVAAGSDFKVGDAVFGFAPPADPPGALAEYCLVPLERLAPLPAGLSLTEAAALPCTGVTAYQALVTLGKLRAGQTVLINGCTGGIGHIAVQIAKAYGAHVTGTCRTALIDFARGLGVDSVLDYTRENILETDRRFDVILETASSLPFRKARRLLAPGGVFLDPDLNFLNLALGLFGRRYVPVPANINRDALDKLAALVVQGKLKPAVGQTTPLDGAIPAIAAIERGASIKGKAIFTV